MKKLYLSSIIALTVLHCYSQDLNKVPIKSTVIEKCIQDIDFFRVTMLDNKFNHIGTINGGEEWNIPLESKDKGYVDPYSSNTKMVLKMYGKSVWVQSPKVVFERSVTELNDRVIKRISVQIRKDLLPDYKNKTENDIRATYGIKNVFPIIISPGSKEEKNSFYLLYSRVGSPVKVKMDDSMENWFLVYFTITEYKLSK